MKTSDWLLMCALVTLLGMVGGMAMRDEKAAEENYCEMVKGGHWPDYKNGEVSCD